MVQKRWQVYAQQYVYDYLENGTYVDKGLNFTIKSNPYKNETRITTDNLYKHRYIYI